MKTEEVKKPLWRKIVEIILWIAMLVLVIVGGINLSMRLNMDGIIVSSEEAKGFDKVDCIIVLGCGVHDDGTPTPMLRDRVEKGIALYEAGVAKKLLMTGDHGETDYNEVETMKKLAMDAGIPEADIFMDHAGFSTYDSMYRAKEVFGVKRAVVVTQKYHLYRALFIADGLGIEVIGVPADARKYAGAFARECREMLARVKDSVKVLVRPKPKYLGDPIPITGDGRATND